MSKQLAASVIVPTYREAANIRPLTQRLFNTAHEAELELELILVDDDSQDGIEAVVAQLQHQWAVRLIIRRGERSLSSAVLEGFRSARSDRFVVMDADLQHPPEAVPQLLTALDTPGCDFAIATRYARGGSIDGRWPIHRRLVSWFATALAHPIAPLSDPMSGFFALHKSTWERAKNLKPIGYKIALELYVQCNCRVPREVPIRFSPRLAGDSKLNLRVQLAYARQLWRLYRYRRPVTMIVAALIFLLVVALAARWLAG